MDTTTRIGRPMGSKDKQPRGAINPERIGDAAAEFLSAAEVGYIYGISQQRVRIWAQQGRLPHPYQLGENTVRWKRAELDELDAERKPVRYGRRAS